MDSRDREIENFENCTGISRVVAKGTLLSASCPAFVLLRSGGESASAQGSFFTVGDPEHQF